MDSAGFVVSFDGPGIDGGRIDVRDLAPALLSLGKLIDAANLVVFGEKKPIKLEAKAIAAGSFEVYLEAVLSNWDSIVSFLDSSPAQHTKSLLEWLGLVGITPFSLVALYRFLRGQSPSKVTKAEAGEFLIEIDGKVIVVPLEVMRLYQDLAVNRAFNELLSSVESGGIETIEFRDEKDQRSSPSLTLREEDKVSFARSDPPPIIVIDDTRRVALSIRSLTFQEGNKWRLYDGQNTITATIEDKLFINKVDASLLRFAKGDVLICEVRTVQTQNKDGLKTEHTVLRVVEHKPAQTQIQLPFQ